MTYLEQLHPWCIIRPFPDMRTLIVGRFRRRVDAEGHLRFLKQMMPTVPLEIIFDQKMTERKPHLYRKRSSGEGSRILQMRRAIAKRDGE